MLAVWKQRQVGELQVTDAGAGSGDDEVRIQQSGTCRRIQDTTFDFNAGDLNTNNAGGKQWGPGSERAGATSS